MHKVADDCARVCYKQCAHGNYAHKAAVFRNVAAVDCFLVYAYKADFCESFLYRHTLAEVYVFGRHNAARAVLRVEQKLVDKVARASVRAAENTRNNARGHFADDVCGIVKAELAEHLVKLLVREAFDEHFLLLTLHGGKCVCRLLLRKHTESVNELFFGKTVECLGNVYGVGIRKKRAKLPELSFLDEFFDLFVEIECFFHWCACEYLSKKIFAPPLLRFCKRQNECARVQAPWLYSF